MNKNYPKNRDVAYGRSFKSVICGESVSKNRKKVMTEVTCMKKYNSAMFMIKCHVKSHGKSWNLKSSKEYEP